ncbi:type II secretion system protein [Candidatus Sumerlaeota bacterium]
MTSAHITLNTRGARRRRAFTLIELLIVVLIIAILAAIAVPNFLAFQTRAKVSRARSDMRAIATALEAYAVEWSTYPPNDGSFCVIPVEITTPIAYISTNKFVDPFAEHIQEQSSSSSAISRHYTYMQIVTLAESIFWATQGRPCPSEAIHHWSYNDGAFGKYGKWRMVAKGPDCVYLDSAFAPPLRGSDIRYDPTNGVASFGNLLRTQHSPTGEGVDN